MGRVARIGFVTNKYSVFARKPKGRPRCAWEYNIKLDLKKWDVGGQDSAGSGQMKRAEIIRAV
jgi:hypothetical protein